MKYRQLPVIEKSQPIATKYEIKPGAQHQTLRGRKGIYKIVLLAYGDLDKLNTQVRATIKDNPSLQERDRFIYDYTHGLLRSKFYICGIDSCKSG